MALVVAIYDKTKDLPRDELYGLSSQMRRAAVSIPSNIAEGKGMRSDGDFSRFLYHARASLMELQTQILIAHALKYLSENETKVLMERAKLWAAALPA